MWCFFSKIQNPEVLDIKFVNILVERCLKRGVFNIASNRGTFKIALLLTITQSALIEGLNVIGSTILELYKNYEKK